MADLLSENGKKYAIRKWIKNHRRSESFPRGNNYRNIHDV